MLEDVKEILIGIVIFLFLLMLIGSTISSAECNGAANKSAVALVSAINAVSDPNFPEYPSDGVPKNDENKYFQIAPIMLCDKLSAKGAGAAWHMNFPEYEIMYETWPESHWYNAWSEEYPWSGSAGSALMFTALLKAPGLMFKGTKFLVKLTSNVVTGRIVALFYGKMQRVINFVGGKAKLQQKAAQAASRNSDSIVMKIFKQADDMPTTSRQAYKGMAEMATEANPQKLHLDEFKKTGMLKSQGAKHSWWQCKAAACKGKLYVDPDMVGELKSVNGKAAQKAKASELIAAYREGLSIEARKQFDTLVYIPQKWQRLERLYQWGGGKWSGFKSWAVKGATRIGRGIDNAIPLYSKIIKPIAQKIRSVKKAIGGAFDTKFVNGPADTKIEASNFRRLMVENEPFDAPVKNAAGDVIGTAKVPERQAFKNYVKNAWVDDPQIRNNVQKAAGREIKTAAEITDADLLKYSFNMENDIATHNYMQFRAVARTEGFGSELKSVSVYGGAKKTAQNDVMKGSLGGQNRKLTDAMDGADKANRKWTKTWDAPKGSSEYLPETMKEATELNTAERQLALKEGRPYIEPYPDSWSKEKFYNDVKLNSWGNKPDALELNIYGPTNDRALLGDAYTNAQTSLYESGVMSSTYGTLDRVGQPLKRTRIQKFDEAFAKGELRGIGKYAGKDAEEVMYSQFVRLTPSTPSRLISTYGKVKGAARIIFTKQRIRNWILIDIGRILGPSQVFPLTGGYQVTRVTQHAISEPDVIEGGCVSNGICVAIHSGADYYSFPLNESANSYSVKLWRPSPSWGARTPVPIFISTLWFRALGPTENPRFYTVSPCFALYRVWKKGSTVFVSAPIDEGSGYPLKMGHIENYPEEPKYDTASYCYAGYNSVWGIDDAPQFTYYTTLFAAQLAAAYAVCCGGTVGFGCASCWSPAFKVAGIATSLELVEEVTRHAGS